MTRDTQRAREAALVQVTRVYGADAAPAVKRPRRMRDDGDGAASTEPPAPAVPVPRAPPPSMAATTSTTSTASAFQAYSTGRLSSPILPVPPSLLNIGQRMTAGLALCYAAISLRRTHDKKASAQDEHPPTRTDDEGNFLLPPTPPSTSISQAGVDDPEGRYWPWFAGRFRYESLLGVGAFAQTVRAEDMYHPARRRVAIKVQNRLYNVVGEEEARRIRALNAEDPTDVCHVVRLITTLDYCGHFCLVFELLDPKPLSIPVRIEQQQQHLMATTVNDPTIVRRHMERIKSKTVRKLAHQLVVALAFLRRHRLIHADLKPENLLFRADERVCGIDTASGNESDFLETASSSASTSFHVKLIDFGNAFTVEQAAVYFETFDVQSLHYRAPEVLVGIPFDAAIDMWSLGIILCEAWMGRHMFHSDAPGSLMRELIQLMGSLPRDVFHSGKNFYEHYCDGSLVVASEAARFDLTSEEDRRKFRLCRLSEMLSTRDMEFLHFLLDVLEYDPVKRLTPERALRHAFFHGIAPGWLSDV